MKLLVLLTLVGFCTCQAAVSAQNSKITLSATNTTLASVFRQIEQLTDYMFIYKSGDIAPFTDITIDRRQTEVNRILDECLSGTGLSYTFKDNLIIIQGATQQAEEKKVNGKITDRQGHPLPGVTVMIKGTQMGVVTDANGKYTIALPDAKDIFLRFTFIGMKPQEIAYTGQQEINVTLHEEATEIDEVVVTGYQVIDKRKNTSAVTTVKVDDIMIPAATSIDQMLEGRVPGMIVMSNSGEVGVVPKIRIRGTSTLIGNREPLWVVDGIIVQDPVQVSPEELNNPDYINRIGNAIAGLNPQDIERLDILKDAAATALYGSRAANGVVVVTTVAPKPGELRVTYNFNAGVELPDLSDYNLCNAWEKVEVERLSGKYIAESGDPGMQLEKDIAYNDLVNEVRRGVQTDWLAQPLHNVFNHSHSMNVSGGVESIRYSLDLNYGTHNGAMIDSYRDNVGVGLNLDYRNKSWLQVMNSISFNVTKSQDSPYGNFDTYAKLQPYWAPYSNDGELLETLKDGKTTNPLYRAEKLGSFSGRSRLNDLTNNFSINIYFTKNFSFKGQLSMTRTDSETKSFSDPKDPSFKGSPTRERGTLTTSSDKGFTWNTNAMFYFNKGIDKHFINATAGLNVQESHSKTTAIEYRGFQLSNLNSPTYAAEQTRKSAVSSDKSRLLGMLASLNYSYNNVYLLDASFRLDGSSKFGEDKRFAPFWSVGAGVNFHNYSWLKDNWLVSLLRVRGTYGVTGNVNFPAYAAISTYKTSDKWYYDTPSNTLIALGNPKLTWEKTYTLDVGINLGLFHDRLVVEGNYYRKETKNQLEQLSVRTSSGFSTYYTNAGSILNKGFEIKLNTTVFQNDNWTVAVNATLASNKNEITKLGQEAERYNKNIQDFHNGKNQGQGGDYSDLLYIPLTQYYVGASTTAIYAVPSYGIDPSNGKELFRKRNGQSTYVWNAADEVVVGDKSPDAQGSFGINVAWKGFYLNTTFLYQWGAQDYNETIKNKVEEADIDGSNVDRRVLTQRWQNPGDIAPFFDLKNKQKTQPTSRFVQDNNYLAFSSISCGYDFNRDLIRKMRLTSLGLRFNMNDVCRWSNIKQERGTSYPYAKNYSFTLSLGF